MEELTVSQYFKNIYGGISTALKGMKVTMSFNFKPSICIEYPEEREVLPDRSRMRLFNDVDNCISCNQCANICPVNCIYIASSKRPKESPPIRTNTGTPIRMDLKQYTIDTALCCYCGLCTTVCPTECLTHSNDYEYSLYAVDGMKYDYLSDEVRQWRSRIVKDKPIQNVD